MRVEVSVQMLRVDSVAGCGIDEVPTDPAGALDVAAATEELDGAYPGGAEVPRADEEDDVDGGAPLDETAATLVSELLDPYPAGGPP
jgi:hypothetical protein